jgi:hypothetical protein
MNDEELQSRVQELRGQGASPKQIAKALGLRPAEVAPLVRRAAELQQSKAAPADRAVVGCWVNVGWSAGLGLGDVPEWAAADPAGVALSEINPQAAGLVRVLIARRERGSRAIVCGFLVDAYCLGVKNAVGPNPMPVSAVDSFRGKFFRGFADMPVSVDLAQYLVHGAVAYARGLGFEPHPDFADTAPHLGTPSAPTPIVFGRDGKPCYMSGPYDDPKSVIRTLDTTVGPGNYDYLLLT